MKTDCKVYKSKFLSKLSIVVLGLGLFFIVLNCRHKPEVEPIIGANTAVLPSLLVYQPNSKSIAYQAGGDTSVVPTITGSTPMSYTFTSIPDHLGNIVMQADGSLVFKNELDVNTYEISIMATNAAGSVHFKDAYTATVVSSPSLITDFKYVTNTLSVNEGVAGISVAPSFAGTAPVVFALTSSPVTSGITINNNGIITVANSLAVGTYVVSVDATNSVGAASFPSAYTITINPVLATGLNYSPNFMSLVVGNAWTSAPPTITAGTIPITYSITTLPVTAAITINASTGSITADNTVAIGVYAIAVTATNGAGNVLFTNAYTVTITATPTAPSALIYTPSTFTVDQGNAGSSVVPVISGTTPIIFALSSSPANAAISINSSTGVISVLSTSTPGTYVLTVDATNSVATTSFTSVYTVTINPAILPFALNYSSNALTIFQGATASSVVPSISGTTPITYTLSSSPANSAITINSATGVITVATVSSLGTFTNSVTATNAGGNTLFTNNYSITVNVPLISFAKDIKPIIVTHCGGCHNTGGQVNYQVYTNSFAGINAIIDRTNRTVGTSGFMPSFGLKLSQPQLNLLQKWLDDGLQP